MSENLDSSFSRGIGPAAIPFTPDRRYVEFLERCQFPLVVVGALQPTQQEAAVHYLVRLNAPIYAEGISGIREDLRLQHWNTRMERIWDVSRQNGYPIDGILRLGGVPTIRLWRDLEHKEDQSLICSVSEVPFSGSQLRGVITGPLNAFFEWAMKIDSPRRNLLHNGRRLMRLPTWHYRHFFKRSLLRSKV